MATLWIEGQAASAQSIAPLAFVNYGHFSTLQVRSGSAQGLELHLERLRAASRDLYGHEPALDDLRQQLSAALIAADACDCTLRATIFAADATVTHPAGRGALPPILLVSLSAPAVSPANALRLVTVREPRFQPQLKHSGLFPQLYRRETARRNGFDDVLLLDPSGTVCEGSTWNVVFIDHDCVVWPQGESLGGVTETLLRTALRSAQREQCSRRIAVEDIHGFSGAAAVNSSGISAIASVDAVVLNASVGFEARLTGFLAQVPWQPI